MLIAFIDKINPNLSNANPPARQCQEYRAEIADLDEFLRGNRTSLDHDLARGMLLAAEEWIDNSTRQKDTAGRIRRAI